MLGATALVPLGLADDQHDLGSVTSFDQISYIVHLSKIFWFKLICFVSALYYLFRNLYRGCWSQNVIQQNKLFC